MLLGKRAASAEGAEVLLAADHAGRLAESEADARGIVTHPRRGLVEVHREHRVLDEAAGAAKDNRVAAAEGELPRGASPALLVDVAQALVERFDTEFNPDS